MNKSYSKIRHIQESNLILEQRLLTEQEQKGPENLSPDQKRFNDYVLNKWGGAEGMNEIKSSSVNTFTLCDGPCESLTGIEDYNSVTWDFAKNQITGTKTFGIDPKPIPLNSNFDTSKKWFDSTWK